MKMKKYEQKSKYSLLSIPREFKLILCQAHAISGQPIQIQRNPSNLLWNQKNGIEI